MWRCIRHIRIINILSDAINNVSAMPYPFLASNTHTYGNHPKTIHKILVSLVIPSALIIMSITIHPPKPIKKFFNFFFSGNCFLATLLQNWNVNFVSTTNVLVLFDGTRSLKGNFDQLFTVYVIVSWFRFVNTFVLHFSRYFFHQQIRRLNPRVPNLV